MPGVDIFVTVEDVTDKMLTYESIELHRSNTLGGTYVLEETEALVAGQFHYTINDGNGDLNKWYKYRFHHDTGPVNSDFSNPFRVDGVTLLRARQASILAYGAGLVIVASGGDADTFSTDDYRVKSSLFRTNRGKGTWLHPTTGTEVGNSRMVKSTDPSVGSFDVDPAWSSGPSSGDEFEWHWLADPNVWNDAAIRAFARYWFIDRIPIVGVAGDEEYDLTAKVPWLLNKEQIHDVRHYPRRTSGVDDGVSEPYGIGGKWWKPRQDREVIYLVISPTIDSSKVLYVEASRPMSPLYTDASAAPAACQEELVSALMYDEVLAHLSRPGNGTIEQRNSWKGYRREHASELHKLLVKHRPRPDYAPAQLPFPPVVPRPFQAR